MSHGLDDVEIRILEILGGIERLPRFQIAFKIAGGADPTPALAASVRRALVSLRTKGLLVRMMGDWMLTETWQRRVKQREHKEVLRLRHRRGSDAMPTIRPGENGPDQALDSAVRSQIDYRIECRRLPKILALLGSTDEGAVLNAARQAEQIRRRLRVSWEEIIVPPQRVVSRTETEVTAETEYGPNFSS